MNAAQRWQRRADALDPAKLAIATDEFADIMITLSLCCKLEGMTNANLRACAAQLKKRMRSSHSHDRLQQLIIQWDAVGLFLQWRRQINNENATIGIKPDNFL